MVSRYITIIVEGYQVLDCIIKSICIIYMHIQYKVL